MKKNEKQNTSSVVVRFTVKNGKISSVESSSPVLPVVRFVDGKKVVKEIILYAKENQKLEKQYIK